MIFDTYLFHVLRTLMHSSTSGIDPVRYVLSQCNAKQANSEVLLLPCDPGGIGCKSISIL